MRIRYRSFLFREPPHPKVTKREIVDAAPMDDSVYPADVTIDNFNHNARVEWEDKDHQPPYTN